MADPTPPRSRCPPSLDGVELVRSVRTPAALDYTFTAGEATTRFLRGITEKKILGERAPGGKVYVPSRGADPQLGVPTAEQVELAHVGTSPASASSTCSSTARAWRSRTRRGLILLDGADLPIMHLIQECPVDDVHIGMRVEAVWVDDADLGPDPREHQVVPAQRRARRRRSSQPRQRG